jgi:hypothetical protein
MKTSFRGRHEHLKYLKASETARRIVLDPCLIERAREFVENSMACDPHQHAYTSMWRDLLDLPAEEIAAALTEVSCSGTPARSSVMGSPRERWWH